MIEYARGFGIRDTAPVNRTAPDFSTFCQAIMDDRATAKGQGWIAAAFNGTRSADNAQPRRWIGLDMDGASPDEFAELLRALETYSALVYTTASSTAERPRARVVIELAFAADRASARATSKQVREILGASLAFDASTDRAEQLLFLPLHTSQHWRFTGRPVVPVPAAGPAPSVPVVVAGPAHPLACRLAEHDMEHALDDLRSAKPGNRNNLLAAVADRMGGYVAAGRLDGDAARAKLIEVTGAWSEPDKTARTIDRQMSHGKRSPLALVVCDADRSPIPTVRTFNDGPRIRNAADLMQRTFPKREWAIDGIIPSGVSLLSGPSKAGKSFLVLQFAYAIATGSPLWEGRNPETLGDVLYLALEDNDPRMQKRLGMLRTERGGHVDLSRLNYAVEWSRAETGVREIIDHLQGRPQTSLVIIDTLAKFRDNDPGRKTAYAHDYESGSMLMRIAREFPNVAILVVTHNRKMAADDAQDEISGTTGLVGSIDNPLVLRKPKRGSTDHSVLHVNGRDIDEPAELALIRTPTGFWVSLGTADEVSRTAESKTVLDVLRTIGGIGTPTEIHAAIGSEEVKISALRMRLSRMVNRGELHRDFHGQYSINSGAKNDGLLPPPPSIILPVTPI